MHDLIIRDGLLVDGSGAPPRHADLAVQGDRIAAIGHDLGPARRRIDAAGRLVLPGWVDIHTHYDGQAIWDGELAPSSWHGVTTAVFGNCGVGFAPVRPGSAPYLINLMEGVEDIPGTVLAQGLDFRWESFPDYLDALADTPRTLDIGAQVPHAALRFYVMGERGADHAQRPDGDQIATMGRLLEQALAAGALGFSTSRTTKHRAADGRPTPSLSADEPELHGLAHALRRAGRGVLQVNSDFGPGEFEILRDAAALAGRPLSVLLLQTDHQPELWRQTLAQIHAARRDGLAVTGQVGSRPIGLVMGLETSMHPFASRPSWRELADLAPAARVARLRRCGAARAADPRATGAGQHGGANDRTGAAQDLSPDRAGRLRAAPGRRAGRPGGAAATRWRWRWTGCCTTTARACCCTRSRTTTPATSTWCGRCCSMTPPCAACRTAAPTSASSATPARRPPC